MGTGLQGLGEKQVNFTIAGGADGLAGTQADPAVAALSNGNFVVVYENPEAGSNIDLLAHVFDASGNAIGPPVSSGLLNGVVGIDRTVDATIHPAVAATSNGGFLVAYTDTTPTDNEIVVRRYDSTTGISAPFVIDSGDANMHRPNVGPVDDAAIAAFSDGTSIVVWEFDFAKSATDHDLFFGFLNSTGTGFVHGPGTLAVQNGFEGEARVAASGNIAAIVYAADPGTINGGQDVILRLYNSSGTEVAAPSAIFGTASSDIFSHPDVAALSDGRFVIVARDETTSTLRASIYNPATHVVTPVNLAGLVGGGTDPHVAGVPGGGFVLSFDNSTGDVTEARFGPGGSVLLVLGPASSFTTGAQDQNAVAANASGTAFFAWQDAGSANPNSTDTDTRIEAQAFHVPPLPQPDFNDDLHVDILLQSTSGQAAVWEMNGNTLIGGGVVSPNPGPGWKAIGTGDFNDDGLADILLQNTSSGQAVVWEMNGNTLIGGGAVNSNPGPAWKAIGTGDFNDDGHSDILWQNANGQAAIWEMNGKTSIGGGAVSPNPGPSWKEIRTGDFNGDGKSDILWQNASGQAAIWEMNGNSVIGGGAVGANPGPSWKVIEAGDFNGDGKSDILWQNANGQAAIWEMNGTTVIGGGLAGANPGPSWQLIGARNFKGDDFSDILWQNANGQAAIWEMHGTNVIGGGAVSANPGSAWRVV